MRIGHILLSALAALTLASCSDGPSGPGPVPPDELIFIRAAADAPPLETQQIQFWAVAGETREVEIEYADVGQYGGDECLRFKIPGNGLLRRPDGTRFERGDSVLITITVVDPDLFNFEFQPSGLRFDPDHPAELRVSFKWADPDFNNDGRVDSRDERFDFGIWHQALDNAPWRPLATIRDFDLEEVRADILGFSKYAMAGD